MKNILTPIDLSEVTEEVINYTIKLSKALGSRVTLLHVFDRSLLVMPCCPGEPIFIAGDIEESDIMKKFPQKYEDLLEENGIVHEIVIREGSPADAIVQEAGKRKIDLIIIGSHGHGALYHLLLGSVSESVLQNATCPVMVVKTKISES